MKSYNMFCDNLNWYLEAIGLTKQAFSERTGISISFLSDLALGKANPSLQKLDMIAEALGIPLSVFFMPPDSEQWRTIKRVVEEFKDKMELEAEKANKRMEEAINSIKEKEDKKEGLPDGFIHVDIVLTSQKAFIANRWAQQTKQLLNKKT